MGLASIAAHKLGGILAVGAIFKASIRIGETRARYREKSGERYQTKDPLPILQIEEVNCGSLKQRTK
jgi:cysteine sulfinate desulfinase/cysteine desulfurase-like protein